MVSLRSVDISNFGLPSRCLQRLLRRRLFETIYELGLWASSGHFKLSVRRRFAFSRTKLLFAE